MGLTNLQRKRNATFSSADLCSPVPVTRLPNRGGFVFSSRVLMVSLMVWSVTMTVVVTLSGLLVLLFLYSKSGGGGTPGKAATSNTLVAREQRAGSTVAANKNKPEKSFWPGIKTLDLKDCDCDSGSGRRAHGGSSTTRPQRPAAHRRVHDDLLNFRTSRFHRDIGFNVLVPAGGRQIHGFYGIFHLNLVYRRDNELHVQWKLNLSANPDGHQMEPLACWIADGNDPRRESGRRCFREPRRHLNVGILQRSSHMCTGQNCFMRTSSCQFYLRPHQDYVTEPFRALPARFVARARRNSENVAPSVPFVHAGALPDAAKLAQFLLSLDTEHKIWMSFFKWRLFYNGRRGRTEEKVEFLCQP